MPVKALRWPVPLSQEFTWFIGACEVLGAAGLVLPGLLRARVGVTIMATAASGLALLTLCAAVYELAARRPEMAVFALTVGLLAALVAYGRWRLAPLRGPSRPPALAATG